MGQVPGHSGLQLEVKNLILNFGGVQALSEVSFHVAPGEILAIIGPNGAGKTCVLNSISGFYRPQSGEITFEGTPITHMPAYRIPMLGIARTFQNMQLYGGMSALDNLMAARHIHLKPRVLGSAVFSVPSGARKFSTGKW